MKKPFFAGLGLLALQACAQPQSTPLPPYQLADGRVYQDVVSIAGNRTGTAPVVTMVNTYALIDGSKGAANCGCTTAPVATASGAQPGFWANLLTAIGPGIIAAVIADAVKEDRPAHSRPDGSGGTDTGHPPGTGGSDLGGGSGSGSIGGGDGDIQS